MLNTQCILNTAEDTAEKFEYNDTLAENYTYYSSKYSPVDDENVNATEFLLSLPEIVRKEEMRFFQNLSLYRDTHFYNINVNTSHSSVHLPTNVYHRTPAVRKTMMWSEGK